MILFIDKKQLLTLLTILVFVFLSGASGLAAPRKTEGERLAGGRKRIEVLREFLDGQDAMLATVALHHYMQMNRKDPASAEVVATLKKMVADGRDLGKTAIVASLSAWRLDLRSKIISALIDSGQPAEDGVVPVSAGLNSKDSPGLELAAAMLAFNAIEVDTNKARPDGMKLNPGLKNIGVPPELLDGGSQTATELALLAAAYSADKSVKDEVMRIASNSPSILGAKLYYMANTGIEIQEQVVEYVFRQTLANTSPVRVVIPGRSAPEKPQLFDLVLPGAAAACRALAVLGEQKYLPMLNSALRHEDHRVQIEAVRAIGSIWGPDSNQKLLELLQDCDWPVAVEICAVLRRHPNGTALPALINRLHRESGYLRQHLVYTLSCIAGDQKGQTSEEWKKWWLENRAQFAVDKAASEEFSKNRQLAQTSIPSVGYFYGLPIYSDRFVYVVDSSASMRGERIKSLRENLRDSINALQAVTSSAASPLATMRAGGRGEVCFSIADFGGRVEIIDDERLIDDKRKGVEYAEEMPLTYGTRMFDALEVAMSIPEADTFYLLSDGAPIVGQLDNWRSITAALRVMTRYRPIAIYCVAFSPRRGDEQSMKQIAREHFGLYGTAN